MHLLAPWWWLLLAPLAGALIVLYLLKLRRRDYTVPSVFLWEQALQDLQANAPLQKLRTNLLLLLQLLVLLLAVAALTRPALQWVRPGGQSVVLVLDASASMQATDVAPSRFAVAKKRARAAIEALGPRDQMMLVAMGGTTRALTTFISDKSALHAALTRLQPTDARADLRAALELAAGLMANRKRQETPSISVISDGALPRASLPSGLTAPLHFTQVGRRCDNVGIVVMDVRRRLSRRGGFEGLVVIRNFSAAPKRLTLEIALNGTLRDARALTLPPRGQRTEMLQDLPSNGGVLSATLDIDDDLAVDNAARVILAKVEPAPVVLVSPGNLFLETALSLDPTLKVTRRTTPPATVAPGTVLVADNVPITALPAGAAALLLGPAGVKGFPGKATATTTIPTIVDWDRRHPVLRYVDLTDVHLANSAVLAPGRRTQVLIDSDAGPVAACSEQGGRRLVALGWDLHRSDFPLRPSFPIFLANSIDWLSGQRQRAQTVNVRTGQLVQVPLPAAAPRLTLRAPDGTRTAVTPSGALLTLDRLTRAGVYRVTGQGVDVQFAANVLDTGESNLAPRDKLTLQGRASAVVAQRGPVRTEHEFWRGLLLLALGVLCLEWWIFHRRIG